MEKDEVMNILTEYTTNERLSKFIMQNEEYRTALQTEEEQYNALDKTLTDEQKRLMDLFATASSATIAITQKIIYQQGLKDMFNFIMSLQGKDEVLKNESL